MIRQSGKAVPQFDFARLVLNLALSPPPPPTTRLPRWLDKVDSLGDPNYIPEIEDILHTRRRHGGIANNEFRSNGREASVYDIGGMRGERRRWIHLFEEVHTVIFSVALSEYDLVLLEDGQTVPGSSSFSFDYYPKYFTHFIEPLARIYRSVSEGPQPEPSEGHAYHSHVYQD